MTDELVPLMLRTEQAARVIGVSRWKMQTLIRTGEVVSVLAGGCRLVPYHALEQYTTRLIEQQSAQRDESVRRTEHR